MEAVLTGCPYDCGGSCPIVAYREGEEIVRLGPLEGPDSPESPQLRPCARGLAQLGRFYHPERLRGPLKRVGERGEGRFVSISWEEALDTVAAQMRRIKETYGPQAIFNLRGAGNTDGLLHRTGAVADRFFNAFGGQTAPRGIISWEGALFASRHTFGYAVPPPAPQDILHSKLAILWGFNPSEAIRGTNTNYYLALARDQGTRFIFIDPRFSDSAAALAHQWVPILPGTDCAMLIAMATVMLQEGLYEQAFLDKYTYGFDQFRDYCLGREDGVVKTPAWAEKRCGVEAGVIANLAREYARAKPACLIGGWAPGRTAFGEQFHRACIALAAMTGNIGRPGGGTGCWTSQNFLRTLRVSELPRLSNPTNTSIVVWRWPEAVLKGTAGGYPSDIKMIYALGSNRLNQVADVSKGIQALKKVEFVVVQDQFLTPLARYADIVLAANTHLEREDIQVPHERGYYFFCSKRVVDPLPGAKSDLEICTALAQRLGIADFNPRTEGQWLEGFLSQAPVDAAALGQQGVYFDPTPPPLPLADFIANPEVNPLPTPSGKIELYSQTLAQRGHPQLPPIPQYIEAWEGPHHPLVRKYPLLLVTGHSRKRVHSTFDNVPYLRELEPHTLWISSADAQARGIKSGDKVKVYNDIGTVVITAQVTERIRPGAVNIYQGAWYRPDERGWDWGGCVNVLCKDVLSPGEAAATNAHLVEVAPMEG